MARPSSRDAERRNRRRAGAAAGPPASRALAGGALAIEAYELGGGSLPTKPTAASLQLRAVRIVRTIPQAPRPARAGRMPGDAAPERDVVRGGRAAAPCP